MTCTKSTLGRVLARYYNWYGMTGKLRAVLKQLGWTEERIMEYDRANRLTVSTDHEGENPKVPAPSDTVWLKAHKPLRGGPKRPSHLKRGAWRSLQHPSHIGTGLVLWPFAKFADTRSQLNC